MNARPEFDEQAAHRHFSAECFNAVWGLLEKAARTPEEDEEMLRLAFASYWHWTRRKDVTAENLSVSYWQLSRVNAVLRRADEARRYGRLCLELCRKENVAPFYLGYAYEALARAESTAGESVKMSEHLREARKAAERVTDEDSKKMLLADLETIS